MSENEIEYLRRLFHIQNKAKLECQSNDVEQAINIEAVYFLNEFGRIRWFGEPKFIDPMRKFYIGCIMGTI